MMEMLNGKVTHIDLMLKGAVYLLLFLRKKAE